MNASVRPQRSTTISAIATACAALAGACAQSDPRDRCSALATLELIDFDITAADEVAASDREPAHCRVLGVIDTEIHFELLLPDQWNGRFVMGGGGGFVGSVQNQAQEMYRFGGSPLSRGYATAGTDTGHTGSGIEAGWALNNPDRQIDFGHRAVHVTAEASKSIIQHYYDGDIDYSYFVGCSRGGGQGMMESQRYPDDFDGIVTGAPAYHWTGVGAGFLQTQQALYPAGSPASHPLIRPETRALLASRILEACDAQDGVTDGVLNDPRACPFTPDHLPPCPREEPAANCVTSKERAAIRAIYEGPMSSGARIYPGFPLGGENDQGGWDPWITGGPAAAGFGVPNLHYAFGTELYKYFVFGDPNWNYATYDFSSWAKDTARTAEILNATSTELDAFKKAGGRLILWQGWSDAALTALGTIEYYEALEARDAGAGEYARLFMMPGVLHCSGGPGPDSVDWIEIIRAWVEDGKAPDRVIAAKLDSEGRMSSSRPLCPHPQVAIYDGKGAPNDAASFACR